MCLLYVNVRDSRSKLDMFRKQFILTEKHLKINSVTGFKSKVKDARNIYEGSTKGHCILIRESFACSSGSHVALSMQSSTFNPQRAH